MLKKVLLTLLVLAIIGAVCAMVHHFQVAYKNKTELASFTTQQPYTAKLGKVLVIYYSLTGHTQDIARQITVLTQADEYRIQTQKSLKLSPAFYARVKKELNEKIYPPLVGELPDVSGYDTVFVGGPVWWYTMATPLYSLLAQLDFKGKPVIVFSRKAVMRVLFGKIFKQTLKMPA